MKNEKAQALVEYILIVALMAILIITLVKYFGGYLKDAITKTGCTATGEVYVKGKKPGEGTCKEKTIEELEEENNKED